MDTPIWPSSNLITITPSDSTTFTPPIRQLYVGTGGNISVVTQSGTTVIFKNASSGSFLAPFYLSKVNATNTTAADIIAFV
jgi:hypothetical protein